MQPSTLSSFRTCPSPPKYFLKPVCGQLSALSSHIPSSASGNHWSTFCFYKFFWAFHPKGIMLYVVFCIWLLWLGIMFLRLIRGLACISILFLFIAEWCFIVLIYPILFTFLLLVRHLDHLQVFTIMNDVPLNMHGQVFEWIYVFIFLRFLRMELLGRMIN